ncbi:DNA-binding transcriptional regulator [Cryobacterium sp. TMT1-2-2]|uniref:sugar-binding transcriptional regulator n=1 Tax=Cryobacterium sp. TMT1-2-2 TaxID=1259233 RepID=UPI00106A478E|nr:sugar-binding domain-containing protein [Cryobacterium sp. TMT1-2-2]TFD14289.1 DNA-binding transcriptional regulator [Cryobacterium sp. TMT1-2-2]
MDIGPSELVQMAFVAQQHYRAGKSLVEIADDIDMSRFKVARLLARARETGLVTIRVNTPGTLHADLASRLAKAYGLNRAIVANTTTDLSPAIRTELGRITANLLTEIVTESDVLGIASGRTLTAIVDQLDRLAPCDVVQLTGLAGDPSQTSSDLVRRICEISGGRPYPIYAPLVVSDSQAAEAFKRQPSIQATFQRMSRVTKAVLAVGSWEPPESQLSDALSGEERAELLARGVRAEISATLLDERGQRVPALEGRTLAIDIDQLRDIPEVIVVAGGAKKTEALRAALNTGIVTILATDSHTAQRLLGGAQRVQ